MNETIKILMQILISLSIISIASASLAHFFQLCIKPGNIFSFWKYYLKNIEGLVNDYKEYVNEKHNLDENELLFVLPVKKPTWFQYVMYYLKEPLGLCIYCNGTWINIILFLIIYSIFSYDLSFLLLMLILIISTGINYISIKIFENFNQ
jgi:hypothetical protein